MLTEPHQSRIGAIKELPMNRRRKKQRSKKSIEIGGVYECDTTREGTWRYSFLGIVEIVYTNSALVRIVSTRESDDHLIDHLKNKTVVSLKNMYVCEGMSE